MNGVRIILLAVLAATTAQAGPPEPGRAVELPLFRVLADILTLGFKADENGVVVSAEVTRVTPNSPAAKRDIEVGDELMAVNGAPLAGQNYGETSDRIGQELKPGQALTLSFAGRRGFLGQRRIKYDFVIVGRAAKAG